jgi:hypothetical protein
VVLPIQFPRVGLPPTKISLPEKNNVDKAFVFVGNTN